MLRAPLIASTLTTLVLAVVPSRAEDGQSKSEASGTAPVSRDKADAAKASSAPSPSPEQVKAILDDALGLVQALARTRVGLPPTTGFPGRAILMPVGLSKDLQADTIFRIGLARMALGDRAGARAAWQAALDATAEIGYSPERRTELYVAIARAQIEAGDRDEGRFTLRQALQSARSITGQPVAFPQSLVVVGLPSDHLFKKADLLRQIALVQAETGEEAAAEDALRQAIETAQAIDQPLDKIRALLKIARGMPAERARSAWTKALELAMAPKDEYSRAKTIEAVLRARIGASQIDEALALIADRLNRDLQHYALWVVADAVVLQDRPVAPRSMARLAELATKARYDHPSKKLKVFRRLAEAQARLGDYEGAYRSVGEPQPANNVDTFRATYARICVMNAVAEAQIKAKQRAAARNTLLVALEMIPPLPDGDAEAYFPLVELGVIQAKAGDPAGALRTAEALNSSMSKIKVFAEVAAAFASEGRRDDARKTIGRALEAARHVPNDALWAQSSQSGPTFSFGPGNDPMLPVLQVLAPAQARADDLAGALKTVADMGSSPWSLYYRNKTIGQIVDAQLAVGDITGARKALDAILDSNATPMYLVAEQDSDGNVLPPDPLTGGKSRFLERIARQQAEHGDLADVLAWARKQPPQNNAVLMLRGLADGITARFATKSQGAKPPRPGAQAKPGDR